MSVTKINGFAAPYRSLTLRTELDSLIRRNGVLYMSADVYEYSGNIIIPAFRVVQQGMIIEKTVDTTIPFPTGLSLPFYVTVAAPTAANVDDLTFQFASTPADVAANEVILAEYDGTEFRQMPLVSIDGVIRDAQRINVDLDTVGPQRGLTTSIDGTNYKNIKGAIVDTSGRTVRMDDDTFFPIALPDPDWDRCDRIIYRLPADSDYRIGTRKFMLGGTYSSSTQKLYETTFASSSSRHCQVKSLVDSLNNLHTFYTQGFGASFSIYYTKYNSARTTQLVAPLFVISTNSEYFDFAVDSSNNLHVVYIDGIHLKHLKLNSTGGVISGPYTLDNGSIQCDKPQIRIDSLNTKLFVLYQARVAVNNNQIYFTTRTFSGALITSPKKLTLTATNLQSPNFIISSDLILHIAYEDTTNQAIYYLTTDDIGVILTSPVNISSNTGSTSYGTIVNQATSPKVGFTDNKKLFIVYLQKKTVSSYGITIYDGATAFMPNLLSSSESFVSVDLVVEDMMNNLLLIAAQDVSLHMIRVEGLTTVFSVPLNAIGAYDVSIVKDIYGSLVNTWSLPLASTFTDVGTPQNASYVGACVVAGTINPLVLTANECSFLASSLSITPVIGERIWFNSTYNVGFFMVTGVRTESIDLPDDTVIVTVDTAFGTPEVPSIGTAQFADPDGNEALFAKTVAEKDRTRGLRTTVLPTDLLLTRMVWPGPIILNYNINGIDSDFYGMYGDIDVDWGSTVSGALTMTAGSKVVNLLTYFTYTVAGGTFPMVNGDALYIILDEVTSTVTPQVTPIVTLPWGLPIQVLGFVENGEFVPHLFSVAGMGELTVGEEVVLGQDLSKILRDRLGITGEISYQAYTSNKIINLFDNYPTAISKLDDGLGSVILDHALEESFTVGVGGTDTFTVSTFAFDSDNTIPDIQVFVNDRRAFIDPAGSINKDYYKYSIQTIKFSYTVPEGAIVTIRKERTGGTILSLGNFAEEEELVSGVGGQSDFVLTTLTFSPDNAIPDIVVYVNDRRAKIDPAGGTAKDYWKDPDGVTLHFSYLVPEGATILVRSEASRGNDLTNIGVNIQPRTNGTYSVGKVDKAWKSIFLKDKITSQVYELQVENGLFSVEPRP